MRAGRASAGRRLAAEGMTLADMAGYVWVRRREASSVEVEVPVGAQAAVCVLGGSNGSVREASDSNGLPVLSPTKRKYFGKVDGGGSLHYVRRGRVELSLFLCRQ